MNQTKRFKELEIENTRLGKLVGYLSLEGDPAGSSRWKVLNPTKKRGVVFHVMDTSMFLNGRFVGYLSASFYSALPS